MSRATFFLVTDAIRARVCELVRAAPYDTRVVFMGPKRTIDQNAKMWAMLTDVAEQLTLNGDKMTTEDWKILFLDHTSRERRVVPSLDGKGFVNLGRSSSNLSKEEMADLIEAIYEFGARAGVEWTEPEEKPKKLPKPKKGAEQ